MALQRESTAQEVRTPQAKPTTITPLHSVLSMFYLIVSLDSSAYTQNLRRPVRNKFSSKIKSFFVDITE